MDSDSTHGTLGSQRKLAKRFADETLEEAQSRPSPKLITLYFYVAKSFAYAVQIASWSRDSKNADTPQFAAVYTYLEEYIERCDKFQQSNSDILSKWPQNPGICFSWRAGWSALDVAFQFSRTIMSALECTRAMAMGTYFRKFCDDMSLLDPRIQAWLDQTIQELKTKTLPPPSDWPMWKIHRDTSILEHKLESEFIEATQSNKSRAKGREKKNVSTDKIIKERFSFPRGQVRYRGRDLQLPTGDTIDIMKKLVKRFGSVIPYEHLDPSNVNSASDKLRGIIKNINDKLKAHKVPCSVSAKRTEGYYISATKRSR